MIVLTECHGEIIVVEYWPHIGYVIFVEEYRRYFSGDDAVSDFALYCKRRGWHDKEISRCFDL